MTHSPIRALLQQYDDDAGVSLVEMMVAVLVLSVGIIALAGSAFAALTANGDARNRQLAVDAMTGAIETTRSIAFDDLTMDEDDVSSSASTDPYVTVSGGEFLFDHDGDEADPAEPLVVESDGELPQYIILDDGRTVRTYVTWLDGAQVSKRVTVVVTYDAGGTTRELRESTVIAEANRGLAAPDFTVAPPDRTITEEAGREVCFPHALINEGERDKHDFTVQGWVDDLDDVLGPTIGSDRWVARADIEGQPMVDSSGDLRPDSPVFLERGGELALDVCYDIPEDATEGDSFTWTIELSSALDPSVVRQTTNTVVIGPPGSGPSTGAAHPGFVLRFEPDADPERTFVMDNGDILDTELTDYDGDGLDGWRLKTAGANPENLTRWDWQHTGGNAADLDGFATLRFYSASPSALQDDPPTAGDVSYEIELQILNTQQKVQRSLDATTHTYEHDQPGWMLQTVQFDFSDLNQSHRSIGKNQYLRLEVRCGGTTGFENCHMAFDALIDGGPEYGSALDVPGTTP